MTKQANKQIQGNMTKEKDTMQQDKGPRKQ